MSPLTEELLAVDSSQGREDGVCGHWLVAHAPVEGSPFMYIWITTTGLRDSQKE